MTAPSFPWGDFDPWQGQRPAERSHLLARAQQLIAQGHPSSLSDTLMDLGVIEEEEKRLLSGALVQHFNLACAKILEDSGTIHWRTVLSRNGNPGADLIAWALRDEQHVQEVERAIYQYSGGHSGKPKERENLWPALTHLINHQPNTTLRGLMKADLESVVRDTYSYSASNVHLGMRMVEHLMINAEVEFLDLDVLGSFIERCLERPLLERATGRAMDDEDIKEWRARNVDPLIRVCVGPNAYHLDQLKNLSLIHSLLPHTPTLRQAMEDYWNVMDPDMPVNVMTQNETNGFIEAAGPNKVKTQYPDSWRARNFMDALIRGNHGPVRRAILGREKETARFWGILAHGPNLAALINNLYAGEELRALAPLTIQRLGAQWRDEQGNNLAHLWVWAPRHPERMALMALARTTEGAGLFTTANHAGETPLDWMGRLNEWKNDGEFIQRMARKCARGRRDSLKNTAKEHGQRRLRAAPSRM